MQEAQCFRGLFTYGRTGSPPQWGACILGIGETRGADAPLAHAGVFGKGKRVSPGRGEIRRGRRGVRKTGSRGTWRMSYD